MAHPFSIRLTDELDSRLERLARRTGRSKSYYVRHALEEHIADLEDLYAARRISGRVAAGVEPLIPLEDLERELRMAD